MSKLNKQCYINAKGEKKVNCYHAHISKEVLNQTNIKDDDKIVIYAKDNKIIIEKALV